MWFREKVSYVYLHLHLDWKSHIIFIIVPFIINFLRLYLFLERGEGGRNTVIGALIWERNIDQLLLVHASDQDWMWNPGMCSDQESNQQPFGL